MTSAAWVLLGLAVVIGIVDWIAVHEPKSGQFAVSRLLAAPDEAQNVSMIWNVPGTYRKYYLKCFDGKTVPAGFTALTCHLVSTN